MTIELLYTSAAQGLKQGSRGFCTVVCTAGLPINLAQRLEALSGYRHLYQPGDSRADDNPVCHSHIRLVVGGKTLSIVSRVAAYGVDYSQRTNKIAHHVVFDGAVPSCGPAVVLSQSSIMRANWDGECKTLASGPVVPPFSLQPAPCQQWQSTSGDAGWAGVVANAWLQPTGKPVWIVFSESQSESLLMLMQEATALLPESRRWQATFSTYCTNLPPDVECRVRCVVAGSDEARMSIARGVVLDLTKPLGMAPESVAADAARNGFAIGSKSISFPTVASIPNRVEDSVDDVDDFESALANGVPEDDYGLQPQLPSVAPILLKSSKNRGKLKSKRDTAEPRVGFFTSRVVLLAAVGVAIFLSLLGGFAIWFASSNPIAGIVEDSPNAASEPATKLFTNEESIEKDILSPPVATKVPTQPLSPESSSFEKQLSLSRQSWELDENSPLLEDLEVADIDTNADFAEIEIDESSVFTLKNVGGKYKLMLTKNPTGFDFEMRDLYQTVITVGNLSETFQLRIANIPEEPNLSVVIQTPHFKSVFAGEKIKAMDEGKDPDGATNLRFRWSGLRDESKDWNRIEGANSKELIVPEGYSTIRCELEYDSSVLRPTIVESEISVYKIGNAVLNLHELLFATSDDPCALRVSCNFEGLASRISKNEALRAEWGGSKPRFVGDKVVFDFYLETAESTSSAESKFLRLPVDIFSGDNIWAANAWLKDALSKWDNVRQSVKDLKAVMGSVPNTSLLTSHFKGFAQGVKESPSDEFFQSILAFSAWIDELDHYIYFKNNAPQSSKGPNGEAVESQEQVLFKNLQRKFSKFDSAFSGTPLNAAKNDFSDSQVDKQVIMFANDWMKMNKAQRSASSQWKAVNDSIVSLKQIIEGREKFEIQLQSSQKIRIVKIEKGSEMASTTSELISEGPIRVELIVDLQVRKKH